MESKHKFLNAVYYLLVIAALGNILYVKFVREAARSLEMVEGEERSQEKHQPEPVAASISRESHRAISAARQHPLIMVAGHPRSGTTLMRCMLDSHEGVRCGAETHIVSLVVESWNWQSQPRSYLRRMAGAGLTREVMARAVSKFLLTIISKLEDAGTQRLCNKDPFTMAHASYIRNLFPNVKFVFMVRDGRAVVHSLISRNVTLSDFDLTSYEKSLRQWNKNMNDMYHECEILGPAACLPVQYEQLVLRPRKVMKSVLKFLNLPWKEEVLRHQNFIDAEGGVFLNQLEPSTSLVQHTRYEDALTAWVGHLPQHLLADMDTLAPMLAVLGYDPRSHPPPYHRLAYKWGQRRLDTSSSRHPFRRFLSAVHHRAQDEASRAATNLQ